MVKPWVRDILKHMNAVESGEVRPTKYEPKLNEGYNGRLRSITKGEFILALETSGWNLILVQQTLRIKAYAVEMLLNQWPDLRIKIQRMKAR